MRKITKDLSSSAAGLLHSTRASSSRKSPYKWRNRLLRMKCEGYTCKAEPACVTHLLDDEATCIARIACHRTPLTAPQPPSCQFLCSSPPEMLAPVRIWLSPQNLEQARYRLNHLLLQRLFMSHHISPPAKFQRFEEKLLKLFCVILKCTELEINITNFWS